MNNKIEIILTIEKDHFHCRPTAPVDANRMPEVINALKMIIETLQRGFPPRTKSFIGSKQETIVIKSPPTNTEPTGEKGIISPIQRNNINKDL